MEWKIIASINFSFLRNFNVGYLFINFLLFRLIYREIEEY